MSNTKGSKSARTTSPKTAETVVTAQSGALGTITIPDATPTKSSRKKAKPANRVIEVPPTPSDPTPPPKPAGRKRKPAPTVATNAEVPEWGQRAAARDTAAEMAEVPEAAPVVEPATEAPKAKKGRTPKAKSAPIADSAAPGSLRAIGNAWIESIRAAGHSKSTVSSYTNDLEVAYEYLGGDTAAAEITEKQIAAFNVSKGVMKLRNGKPKAQPTILKVRRALRLALVWAEQKGLIKKAPYSAA